MTRKIVIAALLIGLTSFAAPALAHHSAARFDFSIRDVKWAGTVKEFKAQNPHTRIVLEVSDAKGTRDVRFEAHSLNNIYRNGWRPGDLKVGDKVTLITSPRKDGADGGYVLTFITADGRKF
jgi:hypothetical protein